MSSSSSKKFRNETSRSCALFEQGTPATQMFCVRKQQNRTGNFGCHSMCQSLKLVHQAVLVMTLLRAKARNKRPPAIATVRWLILMARSWPPTTAVPVHSMCPTTAPTVTPTGLYTAASETVAICDRSPHSAPEKDTDECYAKLYMEHAQNACRVWSFQHPPSIPCNKK